MAVTAVFYNTFRKYMADGTIDLDTDTFKISAHTSSYTPSATSHTVYADLTNELATANGYTSGGATLGSVTWTQSTGTVTFDAADIVWTASGGSLVTRTYVIRKSGTANTIVNPLMLYITDSADTTTTTGNMLTITLNASGIFTLS